MQIVKVDFGRCICVHCLSLQVSMAVGCEISNEMTKSQPPQPPPSAGSKKGKDKGKGKKVKDVSPLAQLLFILSVCMMFIMRSKCVLLWKLS